MRAGRTLDTITAELERQADTKRDLIAPARMMAVSPFFDRHALVLHGGNVTDCFPIRDIAHAQLAEALEIPRGYYDRMERTASLLYCQTVKHWLSISQRRHMVRTLDGEVRAILSDRYRPLDSLDLAEAALPVLADRGFRVVSAEITERRFFLKAVTPRISGEVKRGDVVQAGIVLSNSEVGHGSLSVEPLFYFLACTNGLVLPDARFRRMHVGKLAGDIDAPTEFLRTETRALEDAAFWSKVRDVVAGAMDAAYFDQQLRRLRDAGNDAFEARADMVVDVTAARFRLSEDERNRVLGHLLNGHAGDVQFNRYGLAQAIARTAEDLTDYERASELEQLGGTVIELPRQQWRTIAEARAAA